MEDNITSAPQTDATFEFARFISALRIDEIPEATVDAAINLLLDTFGSSIAATHAPGIRELVSVLSGFSPGVA